MSKTVKRLVKWFRPEHYQLDINQNAERMTFSGSVEITGAITKKAISDKKFYLHGADLSIQQIKVNGKPVHYKGCPEAQEIEVMLEEPVYSTSKLVVYVEFSGAVTKQMHGLYPCFYTDNEVEKKLLITQFESHHAREVFPCIDEPEAKATFQLAISSAANDVVVSNTPIAKQRKSRITTKTTFEKTPVMSTYLLAWVSGDLVYEETTSKSGICIRSYSTPVHKEKLAFSLDTARRAMDFLEDYFDTPYPLPKYDQIAVPDFAAGAMENWGCVTFRESTLLIDPVQSDLADKQHVSDVVIHELSHQWFGNLVTMRWWNDLWLNEGFASWVPYLVRDALFPEWKIWDHFASGDLATGLRADALKNTHPIVVEINSPDEIRSAFDSISYDKGCSVVNLVYHFIGDDAFRKGLKLYFDRHSYANAETTDLWKAWSDVSGKDVEGFMNTWTTKPGFPLITAVSQNGATTLSQQRFFLDPSLKDTTVWPIPLMRNADDETIFDSKTMQLTGPVDKLNVGQSGFYRVVYKGELQQLLIKKLLAQALGPVDALGVLTDVSEAAKAGLVPSAEMLAMISAVAAYTSEQVIGTALAETAELRFVMPSLHDHLKPFVSKFALPHYKRLGIERLPSDTVDDELLRPMIIGAMSYADNTEVMAKLLEMFAKANDPTELRPELRSAIYQTAVRTHNDSATYKKILHWYDTTTIPGERTALAAALCSFESSSLANKSLGYIIPHVKLQDAMYWIAYSLRNRHNKQLAWQWLQTNWQWISENYGAEKEIDYYLRFAANGFATKDHLKEYTEFFSSADIHGSTRAFEQGKETIRWQAAWRERDASLLKDWLTSCNA